MKSIALAVFDFDGTMAPGDSIVSYLFFARKKKFVTIGEILLIFFSVLAWKLGFLTGERQKAFALRFLQKLSSEERETLDRAFVEQAILPRVFKDAKKALDQEKSEGRLTVLLSASTDHYMRLVAEALGFDLLLCTELLPDGTIEKNCKGTEKIQRLKNWLKEQEIDADWENSSAYGDSGSDRYVIECCGRQYLVNARRSLRRTCSNGTNLTWH